MNRSYPENHWLCNNYLRVGNRWLNGNGYDSTGARGARPGRQEREVARPRLGRRIATATLLGALIVSLLLAVPGLNPLPTTSVT